MPTGRSPPSSTLTRRVKYKAGRWAGFSLGFLWHWRFSFPFTPFYDIYTFPQLASFLLGSPFSTGEWIDQQPTLDLLEPRTTPLSVSLLPSTSFSLRSSDSTEYGSRSTIPPPVRTSLTPHPSALPSFVKARSPSPSSRPYTLDVKVKTVLNPPRCLACGFCPGVLFGLNHCVVFCYWCCVLLGGT